MSHPIIGNPNEVNGDFFLRFHNPTIQIQESKSFYIIKPDQDSFEIENTYFKKLFDENKIIISWSIYSSKTFFQISSTNFKEVKFNTERISGSFEVSFCLCANKDFVFDPPKESVNSFFTKGNTTSKTINAHASGCNDSNPSMQSGNNMRNWVWVMVELERVV